MGALGGRIYYHIGRMGELLTSVFLALLTAAVIYGIDIVRERHEARKHEEDVLRQQLQVLENTRGSVVQILEYLERQRTQMLRAKDMLDRLKAEQERLGSLVAFDRQTVNALFAEQELRNQRAQVHERWIGFALGVVSSVVASMIWSWALFRYRRKKT